MHRMGSSAKRQSSIYGDEHPEARMHKFTVVGDRQPPQNPIVMPRRVTLNPADCDLDFCIGFNGLQGLGRYEHEFAYCWSGARANVGIRGGKYCFGCRIIAYDSVNDDEIPLDQKNVCRVGVSRGDDSGLGSLGETLNSFCIQSTREFSSAGRLSEYGERFEIGDMIVCCVDLEAKPASIGFSKNGRWMGIACHFDGGTDSPTKQLQWQSAFFPHVLLKNVIVHLQFCREDGLEPVEGYKPWASAIQDGKALPGPTLSSSVHDCELIMMVGLPGSGKTTWAEKWVKEHPEKRYVLLGENLAFDKMKVPGLLYKCKTEWTDRAAKIFSALVPRASKLPRNFIIDHTNVYKGSRRLRLKPFANFHKVAVVVFPTPEEFKSHVDKRSKEMGKEIPASVINDALANFVLPMSKDMHGTDEYFDEVWFPELGRADSEKYLAEMKANMNASDMEASPYSHQENRNSSQVLGEHTQSSSTPGPADISREVDMVDAPHGTSNALP